MMFARAVFEGMLAALSWWAIARYFGFGTILDWPTEYQYALVAGTAAFAAHPWFKQS